MICFTLPLLCKSKDLVVLMLDSALVVGSAILGQMSDRYKNSLAEEIQIKIADQEELVTIRLDTNNYDLSIKERIDLLEKCK